MKLMNTKMKASNGHEDENNNFKDQHEMRTTAYVTALDGLIQHASLVPCCQRIRVWKQMTYNMTNVRPQANVVYSTPTQPRASTREYAVVGATEVPTPM